MGLFGALFAGVSGLNAQSNKIGIISNNISNVNTVGYKQGKSEFDTLVVPSGTTSFSPGGVIGGNQQLVSQQGTIAATSSATDIAISGGGMLFVSTAPSGGNSLFTRAGSFTQDANGNFINTNGYYLQGVPIDAATGQPQAFSSLTTVNVSSSATGKPTPTSTMALGANFNASQPALLGPGETITSLLGNLNGTITANQIIVGNDVNGANLGASIQRGDSFSIADTVTTTPLVYTYGGFAIGRNVGISGGGAALPESTANNAGGLGDAGNILDTESSVTLTGTGSDTVQVAVSDLTRYSTTAGANGNYASLSGVSTAQASTLGLTASQLNGEWHVIAKSAASGAGTITLQLATGSTTTNAATSTAPLVSNRTDAAFTGNIFNAKSASDDFFSGIAASTVFTQTALNFSITVGSTTTKLTYNANPNPTAGTFNSLNTLVSAINAATGSGLTAQVASGRLYISATDPNNTVTFINGDAIGTGATVPAGQQQNGINWTQELDLPSTITPVANTTYFNSLQSLANAINSAPTSDNVLATVANPTGAATLAINETNAQQSITFTDAGDTTNPSASGGKNLGSLLDAFGFQNTTVTTAPEKTVTLNQSYNATDPTKNMASGAVTPQFTKDITIFDSLGQAHTIALNVAKIATGQWAVELTSVPPGAVISSDGTTGSNSDGQIASGILTFNNSGGLVSASSSLENINIIWNPQTVGAAQSPISIDFGQNAASGGSGIGITQAAGAFNVSTVQQNGTPTGELTGVNIDTNGFVIATFSNGQTQKMFQLPLANFTNPDGLAAVSGDAYSATLASGPVNPEFAGTSGVGTFNPSALEQSNVDLSTQLTDMIVAQQAYGANAKVLTVSAQLLQQLDQIIQ
jgi:flagellar hook protein FlgE